ncbi:MAG TPA: energy transducer TonB [Bacteroidales bacterium]|nr:energy transducer TonB [Bacteroidales bacterium]
MKKNILTISTLVVIIFTIVLLYPSCKVQQPVQTQDTVKIEPAVAVPDTEYYAMVETPAKFNGGDIKSFIAYLTKNIKYPAVALKKRQQGTVAIQFGVDCYGKVHVFSVLKSSGVAVLDKEASMAINASPAWTPALDKGRPVGQLFLLQIKFNAKTRKVEIK